MKLRMYFLIIGLISLWSRAQPVIVEGKIAGAEGRNVVLLGYNGAENFPIDSAVVLGDRSSFRLAIKIPYQGLYKLLVEKGQERNQDRYIDLLLSNGAEIEFSTVFPFLMDSLKVQKGKEFGYFHEFTLKYNKIQYKIALLTDLLQRFPSDDPFYKNLEAKIRKLSQEKAEHYRRFNNPAFPLANRYISMLRQWDERGDDFSGPFYRGIDLSDTLWMRNVLLHQKIGQYYSYFAGIQPSLDFYTMNTRFIDSVLDPLKANKVLWKNIFAYLVSAYRTMNYPDALEYLKSKYLRGDVCTDGAHVPDIDDILSGMETLRQGGQLPDGMVQTMDSRTIALPGDLPKGKPKLLIIWSHKCKHCTENIPYWIDLHKRYASKGVQLAALHNGDTQQEWLTAIDTLPKEWIHLHEPLGWKGYTGWLKITGTPAYILLDSDNRIVKSSYDLMEIEKILKSIR